MAFELLFDDEPAEKTVEKLTRLFKTNTLVVRKNREVERKKPSPRRTFNFLKRIKKQVFYALGGGYKCFVIPLTVINSDFV